MHKLLYFIITIFLIQGCNHDDDAIPYQYVLESGINEITINQPIEGSLVPRNVYIKTPENFNSNGTYPIVLFFHGAGGSGQDFLFNEAIGQLIDSGQFIGVFPNGHSNNNNGGFWNLGSEPTTADDVEFTNLVMEQLYSYAQIDISKSYAVGFSNGAGMVNLLGKTTKHFRAIAPLFSQQITSTGALTAVRELSVFQINGENDDLIPLNGGESPVGTFISFQESALNWANNFNCNTTATQEELNWGNINLEAFTHANCNENHEVKYMIALDTGHGWNNQQTDQVIYNEIWAFFQQH